MKDSFKKVTIGLILSSLTFASATYAYNSGIYSAIRNRFSSVENTYSQKQYDFSIDREEAELTLIEYIEGLEMEMKNELEIFEAIQLQVAKEQILDEVHTVIELIDSEKEVIVSDIKHNIQNKIEKELEKELNKLNFNRIINGN